MLILIAVLTLVVVLTLVAVLTLVVMHVLARIIMVGTFHLLPATNARDFSQFYIS